MIAAEVPTQFPFTRRWTFFAVLCNSNRGPHFGLRVSRSLHLRPTGAFDGSIGCLVKPILWCHAGTGAAAALLALLGGDGMGSER